MTHSSSSGEASARPGRTVTPALLNTRPIGAGAHSRDRRPPTPAAPWRSRTSRRRCSTGPVDRRRGLAPARPRRGRRARPGTRARPAAGPPRCPIPDAAPVITAVLPRRGWRGGRRAAGHGRGSIGAARGDGVCGRRARAALDAPAWTGINAPMPEIDVRASSSASPEQVVGPAGRRAHLAGWAGFDAGGGRAGRRGGRDPPLPARAGAPPASASSPSSRRAASPTSSSPGLPIRDYRAEVTLEPRPAAARRSAGARASSRGCPGRAAGSSAAGVVHRPAARALATAAAAPRVADPVVERNKAVVARLTRELFNDGGDVGVGRRAAGRGLRRPHAGERLGGRPRAPTASARR